MQDWLNYRYYPLPHQLPLSQKIKIKIKNLFFVVHKKKKQKLKDYQKKRKCQKCRSASSCLFFSNVELLQPFVGRELFAAGFVSCWSQLNEASQRQLVRSLEMAFSSPNIPPEILATLLNLVSFSTFFNFEDMDLLMFSQMTVLM